jgi:S1-C subfamily serine protease
VHINTVRYFRDYYHRTFPIKGSGSGFILDPEGHIITNAHVIEKARKIGVVLWDSQILEGTVLGTCESIDIALVKIDADGLISATTGNSDQIRVGQRVYAIGNPFGLMGGPTITSGVISAINRTIQTKQKSFSGFVQTDAAINPGNSGGPLVDSKGRVIAINTAIIPYAQGIGFATPINDVMECVNQIKEFGKTMKPWIGIYGVTINSQVASYYNLSIDSGVLVTNVVENSPAQKSGIVSGDIIVSIKNIGIKRIEDLLREIDRLKIGKQVELGIVRKNQRGILKLNVEGRP